MVHDNVIRHSEIPMTKFNQCTPLKTDPVITVFMIHDLRMETSDESQSHDLWAADDMIECAIAARGEAASDERPNKLSAIAAAHNYWSDNLV